MKRICTMGILAATLAGLLAACGLEHTTPISMSLNPTTATVIVTQSIQFTATVHDSTNEGVSWSVSGTGCTGPSCGTISTTGLYTAPGTVPNPAVIRVTATAMADASKSASATVTILSPSNAWTWVSGANTSYQAGVYGTKGMAAPSNVPGARLMAASWKDPDGSLWLFGGQGRDATGWMDLLNDLWKYDPATNSWVWMSGSQTIDQAGVYGTKGVASPSNVPGARSGGASWTDGEGRLWVFGGNGFVAEGVFGEVNDLWRYDPASNTWTWISGSDSVHQPGVYGTRGVADSSNVPGARQEAVSWIDSTGKLWLFGGSGYDSVGYEAGSLNDLWKFDPLTLSWTWISGSTTMDQLASYGTKGVSAGSNIPGARSEAISWADSQGRLWLFGGCGWTADFASNVGELNDVWRFDPATLEWTWVGGTDSLYEPGVYGTKGMPSTANVPGARRWSVSWVDKSGCFWLFGGAGVYAAEMVEGLLNDLWKFDPATLEWTWVSGSFLGDQPGDYGTQGVVAESNVPGARNSGLAWMDSQGRIWIFGGYGFSTSEPAGYLNDLWRYDK